MKYATNDRGEREKEYGRLSHHTNDQGRNSKDAWICFQVFRMRCLSRYIQFKTRLNDEILIDLTIPLH